MTRCQLDVLDIMLEWFLQPYRRVDLFDARIPFASLAVALEAANTILRSGKYDRIRIYHANFPEIHVDLASPCADLSSLAEQIEGQVRLFAETVTAAMSQGRKSTGN